MTFWCEPVRTERDGMMRKKTGRFALVLLAVLMLSAALVMAGCGKAQSDGTGSPAKQQTLDDKVNAIVDSMTTTEKVGQMVMIGVQGTDVTDDSLYMLHQYHMGGVILFDRNMESADQTKKLIADLQAQADQKVPLFIGVDEEGASYNINADYVAAEIAGALHAEKLLLLTDIEGVYKDYHDKDTFISTLHQAEAREYIKTGIIEGGMIPKIETCIYALEKGVEAVVILGAGLDTRATPVSVLASHAATLFQSPDRQLCRNTVVEEISSDADTAAADTATDDADNDKPTA